VNKCCGIFQTFGNKRLGDNLLLGIEALIPYFFPDKSLIEKVLNHFPNDRKMDGSVFSTDIVAFTGDFGGVVDFHDLQLNELFPTEIHPLVKPENIDLWNKLCENIRKYLPINGKFNTGSLFAHLFWTLGREAGTIQKLLHDHDISWGTYIDPLGNHCNSHINNFIILPQGHGKILAPLDFDLAFDKNSFTRDESIWKEWMAMEVNGLMLTLAGDQELTTGITRFAKLDDHYAPLKWGLRDTMVLGFKTAMENVQDIHPPIPELGDVLYSLITLALILTEDEVA